MCRLRHILSGVVLASALLVIPTTAKAHGGCGFSFGCYPNYCSPCYTSCYNPCYYPLYSPCYTPVLRTYTVQQPLVQTYPLVQTCSTPYFGSYGGCKVYIHKK